MRLSADIASKNPMKRSLRWGTLTLLCIGHVSPTSRRIVLRIARCATLLSIYMLTVERAWLKH